MLWIFFIVAPFCFLSIMYAVLFLACNVVNCCLCLSYCELLPFPVCSDLTVLFCLLLPCVYSSTLLPVSHVVSFSSLLPVSHVVSSSSLLPVSHAVSFSTLLPVCHVFHSSTVSCLLTVSFSSLLLVSHAVSSLLSHSLCYHDIPLNAWAQVTMAYTL